MLPDGTILKANPQDIFTRVLMHPHVDEQPLTRSQNSIRGPQDQFIVVVQAHDLRDGFGGREVRVDLSEPAGEDFEVIH